MPMITPHLPAQPTASGGMLLLGVHSWQNVDALRRRRVIRKLNREELNHDGLVVMRFIMPERKPLVASARGKMLPMVQRRERTSLESEDGERADLLRFTLAAKYHTKSAHKYLLANAFLRHAAGADGSSRPWCCWC